MSKPLVDSTPVGKPLASQGGSIPSNPDQVFLSGVDYVLVPRPALKRDEKSEQTDAKACQSSALPSAKSIVSNPDTNRMAHLVRASTKKVRVGGREGMSFECTLVQKVSVTSPVSTDLTTVSNLVPGSSTGFSTIGALFDVCRCKAVTMHSGITLSGSPGTSSAAGGVAFDPGNNGAYSGVSSLLESKYHLGPFRVSNLGFPFSSPAAVNEKGYWKWSAKTEKLLESGLLADLVGGNWFPTTNGGTSNAIVGFLKPYCESPGAITVNSTTWVKYHLEFAYFT
jgi:hypothetical protein